MVYCRQVTVKVKVKVNVKVKVKVKVKVNCQLYMRSSSSYFTRSVSLLVSELFLVLCFFLRRVVLLRVVICFLFVILYFASNGVVTLFLWW